MPDMKKDSTSSAQEANKRRSEDAITERLEKDADEMAEEAEKVEQQYDQDHDIFTK